MSDYLSEIRKVSEESGARSLMAGLFRANKFLVDHLYLLGSLPSIVFSIYLFLNEGNALTVTTDIWIPFLRVGQNFSAFFSPWSPSSFGFPSNAPILYLISGALMLSGLNYYTVQHLVTLAPIVLMYLSSTFMFKTANISRRLSVVMGNYYVFNYVTLTQVASSTGINYILVSLPLLIGFSILALRTKEFERIAIFGILMALLIGTASSTEEPFFALISMSPLLMYSILLSCSRRNLKPFIFFILILIISFVLYFSSLLYIFQTWFSALIGNYVPNITNIYQTYSNSNFFSANNFSEYYTSPISGLTIFSGVFSQFWNSMIVAFVIIVLSSLGMLSPRTKFLSISCFVFVMVGSIFIFVASEFPSIGFMFFSDLKPFSLPFIVLNEPLSYALVMMPWELLLIGIGTQNLLNLIYHRNNTPSRSNIERPKPRRKLLTEREKLVVAIVSLFLVILLLIPPVWQQIDYSVRETNSSSYTSFVNSFYGSYKIPNTVPNYVINTINNLSNNQENPVRILWLPTFPGIQQWSEVYPYSIFFPTSSSYINQLLINFVNYLNNRYAIQSWNAVNELGISYIAILKVLNENMTPPTISYNGLNQPYAILGNPSIFVSELNKTGIFRFVSETSNLVIFKVPNTNIIQSFAYGAYPISPNNLSYSLPGNNYSLDPSEYNTPNITSASYNFLGNYGSMFTPVWSSLGPSFIENSSLAGENTTLTIRTSVPIFDSAYTSYSLLGVALPNSIPVIPGQTYQYSVELNTINGSGQLMFGVDFSQNQSIPVYLNGAFLPSPIYTINRNDSQTLTWFVRVPNNSFFLLPFFTLSGNHTIPLSGVITLKNFSFDLSNYYNRTYEMYKPPVSLSLVPYSVLKNSITSIFPNIFPLPTQPSNYSSSNIFIPAGYARDQSVNFNGLHVLLPYLDMKILYGVIANAQYNTIFHSTSSIFTDITLPLGNYLIASKIQGYGFFTLTVNNNTYTFFDNGSVKTIQMPFELNSRIAFIQLSAIIGTFTLSPVYIINKSLGNEGLSQNMKVTFTSYPNVDSFSGYSIQINQSKNEFLMVLRQGAYIGWSSTTFSANHSFQQNPSLITGFGMIFLIPLGITKIVITYSAPYIVKVLELVTIVTLPVFFISSFSMVIVNSRVRRLFYD